MVVIINERQASEMLAAADSIYKFFAFAEGQDESHEARRAEWESAQEESPFPRTLAGIVPQSDNTKGNALTASKKEGQMLIDAKGVSVNKTPRKDGRYQGYATVAGIKKYFYGSTYDETVQKVTIYWNEKQKEEKKRQKELEKEIIRLKAQKELEEREQAEQKKTTASGIPLTFHEFMQYYFERYRVRKVAESTLTNDKYRYKNHILPAFGSMTLEQITDDLLQNFVDDKSVDSLKTAKECNSLISGMFDFAVLKKIVEVNPCKLVIVEPYESEHGVALTREEEQNLLRSLAANPKYLIPLSVALYCGLRPCEYRTATIEGDFIRAQNRKRHSKEIEWKRIPIGKKLKAILGDVQTLYFPNKKYLRDHLIEACPEHKIYDLRTTFNSRCMEAHVDDYARKTWMGHGIDRLTKAYTDLPDSWFLDEMKKLDALYKGES